MEIIGVILAAVFKNDVSKIQFICNSELDQDLKYTQGSKRVKASGADIKQFLPLPHPYSKYFLTRFTLISEMIKFDLLGADFSPPAEKLEPWYSLCQKKRTDQARHVRNKVSALPDTRDKLARV